MSVKQLVVWSRRFPAEYWNKGTDKMVEAGSLRCRAQGPGCVSRGSMELWKVGCQSLVKTRLVFQVIMWMTVPKIQIER